MPEPWLANFFPIIDHQIGDNISDANNFMLNHQVRENGVQDHSSAQDYQAISYCHRNIQPLKAAETPSYMQIAYIQVLERSEQI